MCIDQNDTYVKNEEIYNKLCMRRIALHIAKLYEYITFELLDEETEIVFINILSEFFNRLKLNVIIETELNYETNWIDLTIHLPTKKILTFTRNMEV